MRVLVHADDLGMSPAVNAAILAAWRAGTVRSTSVLATGPAFDEAMAALPGDVDLGLHLDFTGFPSLTGAPELARVRALAENEGGRAMAELGALAARRPELLRAEAEAQLAKVRARHPVTHLDSHHHVHWQPALWPVVRQLLASSGVPAVRQVGAWRLGVSPLRAAPQRLRAARFRHTFRAWVRTDAFCDASTFRTLLEADRVDVATLEVMAHPGNPAHARYAAELEWLAGDWGGRRDAWVEIGWGSLLGDGPRPT